MKYNKLTMELLEQGFTADNHPNYVVIKEYHRKKDREPLENLDGGFVYTRKKINEMSFQTECGLFVKETDRVLTEVSYEGENYTFENNNALVHCPKKSECNKACLNKVEMAGAILCPCHKTDEGYDYERSVAKYDAEKEKIKKQKYQEYELKHQGRACEQSMQYSYEREEWILAYNLRNCSNCNKNYCPILNKEFSGKKGNVYYDVKSTHIIHDGSILDGTKDVRIRKGLRCFKEPQKIELCEVFVKLHKDTVRDIYLNSSCMSMFYFRNPYDSFEICNVRTQTKESRNLLQDLEDIKNGAVVTHTSDTVKAEKEEKKRRHEEAKKKKIEALEKKIIKEGHDRIQRESPILIRKIDALITKRRQMELEEMHHRKKPVQLSIFDLS